MVLCGLLTALTIRYLPGTGGHSPAFGFKTGGGPPSGRELVGIVLAAEELVPLGIWLADAANEAATQIQATVFTAPGAWHAHPSAEIAEIRWLDLAGELPDDLAPLLTDHVLPALWGQQG